MYTKVLAEQRTKEIQRLKINNPQEESEQPSHSLWIEVHLANGEMRPVRLQWAAGKCLFPMVATIYNNAAIMDLITIRSTTKVVTYG